MKMKMLFLFILSSSIASMIHAAEGAVPGQEYQDLLKALKTEPTKAKTGLLEKEEKYIESFFSPSKQRHIFKLRDDLNHAERTVATQRLENFITLFNIYNHGARVKNGLKELSVGWENEDEVGFQLPE